MTALELPATRTIVIPWPLIRRLTGAVLILLGLLLLYGAYHGFEAWTSSRPIPGSDPVQYESFSLKGTEWLGIAVMLIACGAALEFHGTAEAVALPAAAILIALIPFALFLALVAGVNPFDAFREMYRGAFGKWFNLQSTLTLAAPLMLTGLCTALPMRLGMVIIGGEGAFVIGALASAGAGLFAQDHGAGQWTIVTTMLVAGFLAGGVWISIAGALKHYRGVNETISSLLLIYIGIAIMKHVVEGVWLDPEFRQKPSTRLIAFPGDEEAKYLAPIDLSWMAGKHLVPESWMPYLKMDLNWGFAIGIIACILTWILMNHTVFGFSARVVGGNVRAAKVAGLSLGKIILITCMLAGGAAGMAGGIEVAANEGRCNATMVAGYGYAGILVAFLARQSPLGIIPVAILLGGITASKSLLQTRLHLPDATVSVLQGTLFVVVLASETYFGRFAFFRKKEPAHA